MTKHTPAEMQSIAIDRLEQLKRGQIITLSDAMLDCLETLHADELARLKVVSAVNGNQRGLLDRWVVWSKLECPKGPKDQRRHSDNESLVVFI
jgi:hypothetical protein